MRAFLVRVAESNPKLQALGRARYINLMVLAVGCAIGARLLRYTGSTGYATTLGSVMTSRLLPMSLEGSYLFIQLAILSYARTNTPEDKAIGTEVAGQCQRAAMQMVRWFQAGHSSKTFLGVDPASGVLIPVNFLTAEPSLEWFDDETDVFEQATALSSEIANQTVTDDLVSLGVLTRDQVRHPGFVPYMELGIGSELATRLELPYVEPHMASMYGAVAGRILLDVHFRASRLPPAAKERMDLLIEGLTRFNARHHARWIEGRLSAHLKRTLRTCFGFDVAQFVRDPARYVASPAAAALAKDLLRAREEARRGNPAPVLGAGCAATTAMAPGAGGPAAGGGGGVGVGAGSKAGGGGGVKG